MLHIQKISADPLGFQRRVRLRFPSPGPLPGSPKTAPRDPLPPRTSQLGSKICDFPMVFAHFRTRRLQDV